MQTSLYEACSMLLMSDPRNATNAGVPKQASREMLCSNQLPKIFKKCYEQTIFDQALTIEAR